MSELLHHPLWTNLKALAAESFPKQCNCCGCFFDTPEQLERKTLNSQASTQRLKPLTQSYQHCSCGATLISLGYIPLHKPTDPNVDKRDYSPKGIRRRECFKALLDYLLTQGWECDLARVELLKVL